MIYDAFMFFNELEVLDIRLHELDKYVDNFILVESPETFTGFPKPLWFEEEKDKFEEFLPKITHLISEPSPRNEVPRGRERKQRDWAAKGLVDVEEDDWILMGDVDEIPKLSSLQNMEGDFFQFWMVQYFYYLNLAGPKKRSGTTMMTGKHFMDRFEGNVGASRGRERWDAVSIDDGGWHFGFMGGPDRVVLKYQSFCHQEILEANPQLRDVNYVKALMEKGIVTRGAPYKGNQFPKFVPIDESFPRYVRENQEKFKDMIR